jgi:hypothetical protein
MGFLIGESTMILSCPWPSMKRVEEPATVLHGAFMQMSAVMSPPDIQMHTQEKAADLSVSRFVMLRSGYFLW